MYRYWVTPYDEGPPDMGDIDTRIMVPFVDGMLKTATVEALKLTQRPIDFVLIDEGNPGAYSEAFALRWNRGEHLIVVEQDIVPAMDAITAMIDCGKPWCSHPYYCGTPQLAYGLGLCKFSADIQKARPSLGEQAARDHRGRLYTRHWRGLNERIIGLMNHFGHYVHLHHGAAVHLHEYTVDLVDHG